MTVKKQVFLLAFIFALLSMLAACGPMYVSGPGPLPPTDNNWPYDRGDSSYHEFTGDRNFEGTYENHSASRAVSLNYNGWGSGKISVDLQGHAGSLNLVVRDPRGRILHAASDLQSANLSIPVRESGAYPIELEMKHYSGGIDIHVE